jgi:hypothetical protein
MQVCCCASKRLKIEPEKTVREPEKLTAKSPKVAEQPQLSKSQAESTKNNLTAGG